MLLPLLMQSATIYADPGDAPPVPAAAQHAYAAYLECLMAPLEPAMEGRAPADPAARAAMVRGALAGCRGRRVASLAEMEAKAPHAGAWATPAGRHARAEEIIGKAEQRLAFTIVSPDQFRAVVRDLWSCMNAGGGDHCTPPRATN